MPYYTKCPKCKGTGTVYRKERSNGVWSRVDYPTQCTKCLGTGKIYHEEDKKSKRVKNGFLDLLGLGTKTTIYHVKAARKSKGGNRVSKSSWKHKGYVIYKRDDGEFEVPRMDRDSRFDSIFDAKRFIDANTGKGMVNPAMKVTAKRVPGVSWKKYFVTEGKRIIDGPFYDKKEALAVKKRLLENRKNPGLLEGAVSQITSFIPVKGIRKNADGSISLLVDSAKKAIKPITGMLKGVARIGNPAKERSKRNRLVKLINIYNKASDPSVARIDSQHSAMSKRARAALTAIRKSYIEGVDYKELSNGALWPKS